MAEFHSHEEADPASFFKRFQAQLTQTNLQVIERVNAYIDRLNNCCEPILDVKNLSQELSDFVILKNIPLVPTSLRILLRLARNQVVDKKINSELQGQSQQLILNTVWSTYRRIL